MISEQSTRTSKRKKIFLLLLKVDMFRITCIAGNFNFLLLREHKAWRLNNEADAVIRFQEKKKNFHLNDFLFITFCNSTLNLVFRCLKRCSSSSPVSCLRSSLRIGYSKPPVVQFTYAQVCLTATPCTVFHRFVAKKKKLERCCKHIIYTVLAAQLRFR